MQMIIKGTAINENVIEEDDDKTAKKGPEDEVHGSLKR